MLIFVNLCDLKKQKNFKMDITKLPLSSFFFQDTGRLGFFALYFSVEAAVFCHSAHSAACDGFRCHLRLPACNIIRIMLLFFWEVHWKRENSMNKYEGRYILLLLSVTVIAVGVTLWALFFRQPEVSVLAPDYAPQELEQNAEKMEEDGKGKSNAPEGGGSVNLMFRDEVTVDLGDNAATLYYGNPSTSTQDVLLQIVIQDTLVARSGRIIPGSEVKTLELAEDAGKALQPGGYDGKLVFSFYDPGTGEKAVVNTEIPVKITVAE